MKTRLAAFQAFGAALIGCLMPWHPAFPAESSKAPFHVLYSNDLTNLEACVSPYHARDEAFRPEMLEASVDEAAGADAQVLQPGLMWVPLWQSKISPPAEHFRWWQQTFSRSRLSSIGEYVLNGGDVVKVFVDRCRAKGVEPFISVRMNDYHGLENIDADPGAKLSPFTSLTMDRFRREHPEYRLKPPEVAPQTGSTFEMCDARVLNWAEPAVRERMLGLITELCENYDIGGLELDFLRHFRLFRLDETTAEQRKEIIADFIRQVRGVLDRTAGKGRHRWLCVRIPAAPETWESLGLDPVAMVAAGVEMFNLSSNYYTVQDVDIAALRQQVPNAAIYLEMTHCTVVGRDPKRKTGDSNYYRRTTNEQFYTTAHMALARGADGVSVFNFAYYREYGNKPERGPFSEPPFHILPKLRDRSWLFDTPQHYFLAPVWRSPYGNAIQLPKTLSPGQTVTFQVDASPPEGGWKETGKLRIQSSESLPDGAEIQARLNGKLLAFTSDVAEPFDNPYPHMKGTSETLRAWTVPAETMQDGVNEIELTNAQAPSIQIIFLDLALP